MSHELIRLRESLMDVPHLVHPTTFNTIVEYLDLRNSNQINAFDDDYDGEPEYLNYSYNSDSKVGILNIDGPLTYRPVRTLCGGNSGTSYQSLKEDFSTLASLGAKTICFYANSGGGMAYQMMPTARFFRKVADENGIKIITFVDGGAFSACYGLISVSDEIVMAEGSSVGSIGVLIELYNNRKYLEKIGYERTFIYSGKQKIPYDDEGAFKEEFLEELQDSVDNLYSEFTSFVAEHRNMSVEDVINTDAKTFEPSEAISLGLADKEMTVEDFFDYLADQSEINKKGEQTLFGKSKLFNKEGVDEAMIAELQSEIQSLSVELTNANASVESLQNLIDSSKSEFLAQIDELQTQLQAAQETIVNLEAEKSESISSNRLSQLSKFMSSEKASEINGTLASLDDEAFSVVLSGYQLKSKQDANAELFDELGDSGQQAHKNDSPELSLAEKISRATLLN